MKSNDSFACPLNIIENMKIRTGFVSNSSSSSFVVRKMNVGWGDVHPNSVLLNLVQEQKLKSFGFRKVYVNHPAQVPMTEDGWEKLEKEFQQFSSRKSTKKDYAFGKSCKLNKKQVDELLSLRKKTYSWCFGVYCNQDDVVRFLVQNKIGFKASVHYGHKTYIYEPEKDRLIIAPNTGEKLMMYVSEIDEYAKGKKVESVEIITGKQYLEKN